MPELPEVETVVRGLADLIIGSRINSVDVIFSKHLDQNKIDKIIGAKILLVTRRAKYIIIELSNQEYLVAHLKMTGQIIFKSNNNHFGAGHPSDSLIASLPDSHTRIIFNLNTKDGHGAKLFFNDQRKFGYIDLVDQIFLNKIFNKLGPEPLDKNFNQTAFSALLSKNTKKNIKSFLLDQSIVAGLGNIYVDESLHRAKIHPKEQVGNLTKIQVSKLHYYIVDVLKKSIAAGGSSSRNYVSAKGVKGNYLNELGLVYGRENQECLSCSKGTINKIKHAGRGTHFCPDCQKRIKL